MLVYQRVYVYVYTNCRCYIVCIVQQLAGGSILKMMYGPQITMSIWKMMIYHWNRCSCIYPIFRQTWRYMWYTMLCRIYCIKTGRQWYIVHNALGVCHPTVVGHWNCPKLWFDDLQYYGREAKDFPKLYVLVGHTKRTMAASSFCPQSCGVQDGGQIHLQWLTLVSVTCCPPSHQSILLRKLLKGSKDMHPGCVTWVPYHTDDWCMGVRQSPMQRNQSLWNFKRLWVGGKFQMGWMRLP